MEDLNQKLQDEHGINPEQSQGVIDTITNYIKEHVPMVGGMIDQFLHAGSSGQTPTSPTDHTSVTPNNNESTLQKLEDLAKSKLGGMFGS